MSLEFTKAAMEILRMLALLLAGVTLTLCVSNGAVAQTGENVLLVVNDASSTGDTIAKRYAERRAVPGANVCRITTTLEETIERAPYVQQIENPVWRCIARERAQDRILYIVLTKGVPLRIGGTAGRTGTVSSVDSELTLLYRRRSGVPAGIAGFVPNPYFAGNAPVASVAPFAHERHDIYLVTRLDGYTVQDALALIDRAAAPVRDGRFVLDERSSWSDNGNAWLRQAAERLRSAGFADRVLLDESSKVVTGESRVLGYYSWGSNDPAIRIRHFHMEFLPGALAAMFVSSDGRTFKEPPPTWTPSDDNTPAGSFGGTPQSLAADFIRDGATGTAGHVAEPYLDATIRPDILFPAYVSGRNLAEAFYAAMPYLSWQTIVVGDPLCAPFLAHPPATEVTDKGSDPATELPLLFSKRYTASLPQTVNVEARNAYAKFVAREDRGDRVGSVAAVQAAVAGDPRFTLARIALASNAEAAARYDEAIAQYRAILAYAPNQIAALNNLAYALAVQKKQPQDALPFAERAAAIAPKDATILDTLAWIQHLLGRQNDALHTVAATVSTSPASEDADVYWHAAVIYYDASDKARALQMMETALKLNPAIAERAEVQQFRQRLGGAP